MSDQVYQYGPTECYGWQPTPGKSVPLSEVMKARPLPSGYQPEAGTKLGDSLTEDEAFDLRAFGQKDYMPRNDGPFVVGETIKNALEVREPGKIYFYKLGESAYCGYFCPCGCGRQQSILLNAVKGWAHEIHEDGTFSLSPSVGCGLNTCRSHYFMKRGMIEWC